MFSSENITLFYLLLPIVAFLYAAVGHGGASGYLALMALFSFAPTEMKSTALVLNISVSAIAFFHYARKGYFDLKLFLLVGLIAIPFAYFGGNLSVENTLYKKLLAVFLLFAVLKLVGLFDKKNNETVKAPKNYLALIIGSSIGFLSGLLGIGGGIILTPILLFLGWSTIQKAAGISALFIFVNSIAGLMGQVSSYSINLNEHIFILIALVVVGGFFGAWVGSSKFNSRTLRFALAIVLLIAATKLILT